MSRPFVFENSECERCREVKREMVKVGAVVFCQPCFRIEFKTLDPVQDERDKYLEWLRKRDERIDAE